MKITENNLERSARLLTAQHNIQVAFRPGVSSTSTNKITLPSLPEGASQELLDAMVGYLDQQVGYVLFSDLRKVSTLQQAGETSKEGAQFYDAFKSVEDARIETQMEDLYPGMKSNFRNAHQWLFNILKEHWEDMSTLRKSLSAAFLERRLPGTKFFNNFVEPEVKDKAEKINELVKSHGCSSTQDSIDLAAQILDLLEEDKEEDEESRPEPGAGNSAAQSPANMAEALSDAVEQEISDPSEQVQDYEHDLGDGVPYLIYSTEHDVYCDAEESTLQVDGAALQQLRSDARTTTSVMRKRLVNSLRAMQKQRWVGGRPEGRLDPRRAYKAIHGISTDVYKVRTQKPRLDTAVALAIDHSRSMSGSRLALSAQSAIVLGDVFNPLNIPFMVYGFSTLGPHSHIEGDIDNYARWGRLWIQHYKKFEEPWKTAALKLTGIKYNCQQNTLDGESILYGMRTLLQRPESRKILFVFNDGGPWPGYGHVGRCQTYLKDVVKAGAAAGIEVICFGVQTDEVKEYYDQWIEVNDLTDLVKEPLNKIDALLRKGMTAIQRKR